MTSGPASYARTPYLVVHQEPSARKDVYGTVDDSVVLQAQLLRGEAPSSTAIVAMHPIGSPGYLPMFSNLARSGHHVIACASRYSSGDAPLQMENVLLDLGACIRDARTRLGYERIVLAGWSGGGALMAAYQAESAERTIMRTAAGEPTLLAEADLPSADALLLIATHRSRHHLLTEWLDPSVLVEGDPSIRDRDLDLFAPDGPKPPFTLDFLAAYRAAQVARNRRITSAAERALVGLAEAERPSDEHCFVVHGTMADPRWLDPAVDPNDRPAGWSYLGDPAIANNGPAGLGRFCTTRGWLSQWSLERAQVDAVEAGPRIRIPTMVMTASADDACPASHGPLIFDALATNTKVHVEVDGANHYFSGPSGRARLATAAEHVDRWLDGLGL